MKQKTRDVIMSAIKGTIDLDRAVAALVAPAPVAEANFPLRDGESVEDFTRALSTAASDAYGNGAYVEQVYPESVILCFYGMDNPRSGESIRVPWTRDESTGLFAFQTTGEVQVRRVTTWVPA